MADIKLNIKVVDKAAQNSIKGLTQQTKKADRAFDQLNLSIKNTSSTFKIFAGNIAANAFSAAARGLTNLAGSAVQTAGEFETLAVQFEVLTGSAETATKLFSELKEFSAGTPFQLQDLAKAAQRLISFGFSAEEVTDRLSVLGDISAASGTDINDLSLIFGQVAAAGKLTGERLLQLQERAIPIGPALAKSLGVAESSVRDLVSQGKVDFATFQQAFNDLAKEGNFAFEGMAKRSQTLEGRISTLRDNFTLFSTNIIKAFRPAIKAGVRFVTELIQSFNTDSVQSFSDIIAKNIPKAIEIAGVAFTSLNSIIDFFRISINNVQTVVALAASGFFKLRIAALEAERSVKSFLGVDTSDLDRAIESTQALSDSFLDVADENQSANDKIRESQNETEQAIFDSTSRLIELYNQETKAIKNKAKVNKDTNDKITEDNAAFAEQQAENQLLEDEQRAERNALIISELQQRNEELARLNVERNADEIKANQQRINTILAQEKGGARKLLDQRLKSNQAQIELDRNLSKSRVDIFSATANLIASVSGRGSKLAFAISKAAAIAQSIVSTNVAAAQALAAPPGPPTTIPLAANVQIAGRLNTAAIAATAIRGFQNGGIVGGNDFSGDRVNARVNSGEMILNRQQQANLFRLAQTGTGSGQGQEIVVNTTVELDGEVLGRSVSRQVADGLKLGEAL